MTHTKQLVIDVGNTQTKYGYFDTNALTSTGLCTDWAASTWTTFQKENPFSVVMISSVGASAKRIQKLLPSSCEVHLLDENTRYPFTSDYKDINTLGVDRRAAMAGALLCYPKTPVLVIDAGSCITFDFINAEAQHLGGIIAPGRKMRYHAMHLFTEKLPLLDPSTTIPTIGTNTTDSILLGVEGGVLAEINTHIKAFTQAHGNFTIILTGGDADSLNKKIKNTIFADTHLILRGLQHLLIFNIFYEK